MAVGYLDLLQRELRDTVIHPFATKADLDLHPGGAEGQIASTEGSFYIWTAVGSTTGTAAWHRVLNDLDIAYIEAAFLRTATVFTAVIDNATATAPPGGSFQVNHGFGVQPVVDVADQATGAVIGVVVTHGVGSSLVQWDTPLPGPAVVTCVGSRVEVAGPTPGSARR